MHTRIQTLHCARAGPIRDGLHPSPGTLPYDPVRALPAKPADQALHRGALASSPPLQTSPGAGAVARRGVERQAMRSPTSYGKRSDSTRSGRLVHRRTSSQARRGCPAGVSGAPLARRRAASTLSSIAEGLKPAGVLRRVYWHGPMGPLHAKGVEARLTTSAVVRMMMNGTAETLTSSCPCNPQLGQRLA